MTCKTDLAKKLTLSQNIYLSSLLLAQYSQGQSFNVIQSQIKDSLKAENKSIDLLSPQQLPLEFDHLMGKL